jgi:cell wall-associated NlpC family hydrolase
VRLAPLLSSSRLRPGSVIELRITAPGKVGRLVRFTTRRGRRPLREQDEIPTRRTPGATPPNQSPPPPTPPGGPTPSKAEQALAAAETQLGTPYRYGGSTPETGFDDSGLVQWAYSTVGIAIPRIVYAQAMVGTEVARSDLRPGDLVFFRDASGYVHHVGMSTGGDRFIHAPHTGDVVKISSLTEAYYSQQFTGGRRYVD